MAIVYRHRRNDTNEVFYIGIGKEEKRAYVKQHRSIFWNIIVSKAGYTVEIIATDLTWDDACELEEFLISEYGRRNIGKGPLVNLTDGGDGKHNYKTSDETKKKMSIAMTGLKRTDEGKKNISNSKLGTKHSDEVNLKKGRSGSLNSKAKKIIYKEIEYGCKKELYNQLFSTKYSYSHFITLIKNNKLNTI